MGNSIFGHMPSQSFRLIRENCLNKGSLDFEKIDLHQKLTAVIPVEDKFFDQNKELICMKYDRKDCYNQENLKNLDSFLGQYINTSKKLNKLLDEENNNEDDEDFNVGEIKSAILDPEKKVPTFINKIECDTLLLDMEYGHQQLHMAKDLLDNIEIPEDQLQSKNNHLVNCIKTKWDSMSEDDKSSRKLQNKTIKKVNPCQEALQNWWNNSIL